MYILSEENSGDMPERIDLEEELGRFIHDHRAPDGRIDAHRALSFVDLLQDCEEIANLHAESSDSFTTWLKQLRYVHVVCYVNEGIEDSFQVRPSAFNKRSSDLLAQKTKSVGSVHGLKRSHMRSSAAEESPKRVRAGIYLQPR